MSSIEINRLGIVMVTVYCDVGTETFEKTYQFSALRRSDVVFRHL